MSRDGRRAARPDDRPIAMRLDAPTMRPHAPPSNESARPRGAEPRS